jgi:hypothetical protein
VKIRTVCAVLGVAIALWPATAVAAAPASELPICPPGPASTTPPSAPAGPLAPLACRATARTTEKGTDSPPDTTPGGYHHLGAGTGGVWAGVSGRIGVVDSSVRPGTYDFLAGRFMVKRDLGGGRIAWLEVGWAQTGWASPARQHIYTFNTNTKSWQFYDQYALKPGDKAWVDLHTDKDGVWGAWLWWNNRWNLLTSQKLPIGSTAYVEQYVEVHVDARHPGRIDVPPILVDNVKLRPVGGGDARFWRSDVSTLTGDVAAQRPGGLCLDWINRFDTWTAGNCAPSTSTEADRPWWDLGGLLGLNRLVT